MNTCDNCNTTYPPAALACPNCQALTHRAELAGLAQQARKNVQAGRAKEEQQALEQMLELLPAQAAQSAKIQTRLAELGGGGSVVPARLKTLGLGGLGLLLWKFKAAGLFLLTKGKFLLLGLTKAKTAFSMLLSLSFYWTVWGWQFALGFILSIYVHEMGHVAALRRVGIPASAPMFVPFVGAFVRLKQAPRTRIEDAAIGLAGPIYGFGAALVCYLLFLVTDASLLGAIARSGAWINLFNLIPVWQLDGGRGFAALARPQRLRISGLIAVAWLLTGENMLLLLLLGCGYQLLRPAAEKPDARTEWTYGLLIIALSALSQISLPALAQAF